jgi:hypothetical protein
VAYLVAPAAAAAAAKTASIFPGIALDMLFLTE